MLLFLKLILKPFLSPAMTFIIRSSSKQNYSIKLFFSNQAMFFIINNSNNILVIATNLDKNTNRNISNMDNNKFYNYFDYFFIPFNTWSF